MSKKDKSYNHISGLLTDDGQSPTVLAVHAIMDVGDTYPDEARIIIGTPSRSPDVIGPVTQMSGAGFSASPQAARRLAFTLLKAARDVDAAQGSLTDGREDDLFATIVHGLRSDLRGHEAAEALTALVSMLKGALSLNRDLQFRIDDADGQLYDREFHKVKAL
jgi:hypothetical protein